MLMFLFNVFCLFSYFGVCLVVIFALYYFRVLDNKTPVRYQYNPIDFVLDCIKIISFDLQNTSPDDFTQSGIVIYEGKQGSGKTLSMVRDVLLLQYKFPKAFAIDNLGLKNSHYYKKSY